MRGSMVLIRGADQMRGNGCETEGGWFACVDGPVGSAFFDDARWACILPFEPEAQGGMLAKILRAINPAVPHI